MLSWCKSPAAYLQCTQARTVRSKFICLQHMFSSLRATYVSQLMARIRDERCIYGRWGRRGRGPVLHISWSTTHIVISNENQSLLCISQAGLIKRMSECRSILSMHLFQVSVHFMCFRGLGFFFLSFTQFRILFPSHLLARGGPSAAHCYRLMSAWFLMLFKAVCNGSYVFCMLSEKENVQNSQLRTLNQLLT